ncbi:MAG TPA: hypothetical protein VGH51_12775 [Candidatus Angelobacter sp.]|jgi:hypothetical protein
MLYEPAALRYERCSSRGRALAHAIPGAEIVFFEHSGRLPSYAEPEK